MNDYIKRGDAAWLLSEAIDDSWETDYAIDRLNEIPAADVVSKAAYDQCLWERNLAIEQLASIGKGLGEKMDDVQIISRYPNDGTVLVMRHDGTSEVERKKGEWIWLGDCSNEGLYCSCCRAKIHSVKQPKKKLSNFCPNCGADMRPEPPKEET